MNNCGSLAKSFQNLILTACFTTRQSAASISPGNINYAKYAYRIFSTKTAHKRKQNLEVWLQRTQLWRVWWGMIIVEAKIRFRALLFQQPYTMEVRIPKNVEKGYETELRKMGLGWASEGLRLWCFSEKVLGWKSRVPLHFLPPP